MDPERFRLFLLGAVCFFCGLLVGVIVFGGGPTYLLFTTPANGNTPPNSVPKLPVPPFASIPLVTTPSAATVTLTIPAGIPDVYSSRRLNSFIWNLVTDNGTRVSPPSNMAGVRSFVRDGLKQLTLWQNVTNAKELGMSFEELEAKYYPLCYKVVNAVTKLLLWDFISEYNQKKTQHEPSDRHQPRVPHRFQQSTPGHW